MIADWSVEAGPESPSIDVPWDGWINLFWDRSIPALPWQEELALALPEVQLYPELVPILMMQNSLNHFTSKVDVFPVNWNDVDPEIAEACPPAAAIGLGSYIDVVNAVPGRFLKFKDFEAVARTAAQKLARVGDFPGGAEIVIRPASLGGRPSFGWTLYAYGCGTDAAEARAAWGKVCHVVSAIFALEVASVHTRLSQAILDRAAFKSTHAAGE